MLAIVIPYYKYTFFKDTLQSLAHQTDKRFKVYIGDDASSKDPLDLLEKFKGQFDFEYYRFKENLGKITLTKQWERCISLTSNEEWIMLLCDDDYISSNYVEEFYKHLSEIDKLDIKVVHFAVQILKLNSQLSQVFKHPIIEKSTDAFCRKFFGASHGSLTEQIFRKDAYFKYGFRNIPLAWGADDFAWLDFTNFGNIYGINDATAYFRISTENIGRSGYESELKKSGKNFIFKLLVENYLNEFSKQQRLELLLHYQRLVYRYNNVSFRFYIKICKLFRSENEYAHIYKSTRKLIIFYIRNRINLF